jgi:mRNA interferase MazF
VITNLKGDDLILCQITSQNKKDDYCIELTNNDFDTGKLIVNSFIRINKIFTGDNSIILKQVGKLKKSKIDMVINRLMDIIKNN